MPYYWRASRSEPVPIGFKVPGWNPSSNALVQRVETIWGDIRKEKFPSRPSRIGAVFVCRRLKGFCDPKWAAGQVYEVQVRGRTFIANSEYFTEARYAASREKWDDVESWAVQYWTAGRPVMDILEEVVVDGSVVVKRLVGGHPAMTATTKRAVDRVATAFLRQGVSVDAL